MATDLLGDNMPSESKPERYSEMSRPKHPDQADKDLEAFFAEVKAARIKHKIADVHVLVRVVTSDDEDAEVPGFASAHFGAVQEAEGMCAWGLARSVEDRRRFVERMGEAGIRAARKLRS